MQSQDVDSAQHYDPPECDAPSNYYKRSFHELSDNESLRLSSDYGTERSNTPYERKISVERKEHKSSSGLPFKSPSQQQKDNLFATENEENEIAETRLSGNVEGKSVVIIHDVIDTGRQLKRAVEVNLYIFNSSRLQSNNKQLNVFHQSNFNSPILTGTQNCQSSLHLRSSNAWSFLSRGTCNN